MTEKSLQQEIGLANFTCGELIDTLRIMYDYLSEAEGDGLMLLRENLGKAIRGWELGLAKRNAKEAEKT